MNNSSRHWAISSILGVVLVSMISEVGSSEPARRTETELPTLNMRLTGVVTSSASSEPVALFEDWQTHEVHQVRVGDTLRGYRVARIDQQSVQLDHQGQQLMVSVWNLPDATPSPSALEQPTAALPSAWHQMIQRMVPALRPIEPSTRKALKASMKKTARGAELDRATVVAAMKTHHPLQLVHEGRLRPRMSGGQLQGIAVETLASDSLLRDGGFEAGDLVQNINGLPLNDPSLVMQQLEGIAAARSVAVGIERNGKPKTLTFQFKDKKR